MKRFVILICIFIVCFFCAFWIKSNGLFNPSPTGRQPEKYELQASTLGDLDQLELLQRIDEERTTLINGVVPSVVCISAQGVTSEIEGGAVAKEKVVQDIGSGVIISHEGHIVTNYHVISGKEKFRVSLHNGKSYDARKVGADPKLDIAVLHIKVEEGVSLQPLKFGDSDEVRVGQMVFAVGNPFGLRATVTQGIISAKERSFSDDQRDLFQTDAAINPGNSGGPLVNARGEVIGINVAIYSTEEGQPKSQGVGFSLPSNEVLQSFKQIAEKGRPVSGYMGLRVRDLSPEIRTFLKYDGKGVAIHFVTKGSPAEKAGLLPNDIIQSYGGKEVEHARHLIHMIQTSPTDKEMPLVVVRGEDVLELKAMVIDSMDWDGARELIHGTELTQVMGRIASIGMHVRDLEWIEERRGFRGVVVSAVRSPSLADKYSVRQGDRVLSINGHPIMTAEEFYQRLIEIEPGTEVAIVLQRYNSLGTLKFTLTKG